MDNTTAEGRYNSLAGKRQTALERARKNAAYTIPALMPEEGTNETTALPEPWQSVGARGLNNMASRLVLTLFTPNLPSWRASVSKRKLEDAGISPEEATEFDAALSGYEQEHRRFFEASGDRAVLTEALTTHLCTGDILLNFKRKTGKLRYFRLDKFVTEYDLEGNLLTIIVKQCVDYSTLPSDLKSALTDTDEHGAKRDSVDIYTIVERQDDGSFREAKYLKDGSEIDGTDATYPNEMDMDWRVLRYAEVDGEDYGRSYFDTVIADLKSLDSLTQSVVEGVAIAVKTILFVKPGSTISKRKLQEARNGDVLDGNAADITVLRIEKNADLQIAFRLMETLEQRLAFSLLLNSAVQRNAERVTAAEIRFMAQELENALGGFYSRLSVSLQVWYIKRSLAFMQRKKLANPLPKDFIDIEIIGAVDAIGRRGELDALDQFLIGIRELLGPEKFMQVVNANEYLRRRAAALGIDIRALINTEAETQAVQDDAQVQQIVTNAAPGLAQQALQTVTNTPGA